MKTTKKVLSVFLAVVMIVLSCSVCFNTFAADDTGAITDFVSAVQCDAMKTFSASQGTDYSTTNKTYVYTAPSYAYLTQMHNVLVKLDAAIKGLDEYKNGASHADNGNCASDSDYCTDWGHLQSNLEKKIGSTTLSTLKANYKLDNLFKYVLNVDSVTYRNTESDHGFTGSNNSSSSKVPDRIYNVLTIKYTGGVAGFLQEYKRDEINTIPGSFVPEYTYTLALCRQNYKTGFLGLTNHYHSAVNTNNHTPVITEGTAVTVDNAAVVNMNTALTNNADYLSKTTMSAVHEVSTDPATLNAVAEEIDTAFTAFKTAFGTNAATLFNHFFSTDIAYTSVDDLVTLLEESAIVAAYEDTCDTIDTDYEKYASEEYKTYTSTEVNALYNELKTAYEFYKGAEDKYESTIATYYGINDIIGDVWVDSNSNGVVDMDTDTGALPALLAYYYEIFLGSIDDRAFGTDDKAGYVETWQNWTVEDIDNDVVTSADILKAINEVTLDIDTLNSDATDEDVQGYFGISKAELIGILITVKTHLETLGYYAGLNDQLYAQYNAFTKNVVNVINADSSKLYSALSGQEAWHQNLQNFFTTWSAEVGEYKDLLEDDLQATMNTYMQEAYAALKARVVTQIDNAYGLYGAYVDVYGHNVTMASLTYFNALKDAINAIEHDAYNWMKSAHDTYGTAIGAESIEKYDKLQTLFGYYETFVANRGFDTYTQTVVDTVREDTDKDIARENENIDTDPQGEYEVADEDVEAIIDLLEAALKDEKIKKLLGDLINKDEDGNPTGEAFDLANLINGLLEDNLYSDNLINTILQFLYPIVAKAFADVWKGLPEDFTTTAPTDMGDAYVEASLVLDDVDTAIGNVGIALSPVKLGEKMAANSEYASKYSSVITTLKSVTEKTRFDSDGNYVDPWQDAVLFKDVVDEKTGETKQVYVLDWGIDEATDKRAAFIDAACAALSGLEPLLYALLLNDNFVNADTTGDSRVRGCKIGVSGPYSTATVNVAIVGDVVCDLTLDPISLYFTISANDGWDNVLAPLFELLGLTDIPHSEDMHSTRDFLEKGLFAMIDQLIAKVAANPIKTILDIVPNLVYALEADLITPVLDLLEIDINYEADAAYAADIPSSVDWITGILGVDDPVLGAVKSAMKSEEPIKINVGEMLDLESLGLNLSDGLAGILEMIGIDIPIPDVSVLATAGKLVWKDTNRSRWTYSYQPNGVSGKAAHIEANRADVLEYLVKYALGNLPELLAAFNVDTSAMGELVTTILTNLSANADASTAAIVELFNQKVYNTLENYEWYEGGYTASAGADLDFTPATEIYLNPENDWTEAKAEYLYDNLEAIVGAVLTMAKVDFDKETAEVETLEQFVSGKLNGLLSDKTLTALARLLKNLDLNALLNKDKTPEEAAKSIDVNALIKDYLGLDLKAVADTYAAIPTAEEDAEYVHPFGVTDAESFVDELIEMLEPLKPVLDFILAGENITITINGETVELLGYDGYNNAIIPLLEALGCDVEASADVDNALEATLNALVAKITALTTNTDAEDVKDGLIYGVIDMLPGILYFLSSNGLATTVRNLLQPVYVLLDTIRPIYDIDLNAIVAGIEIGEEGAKKPLGLDLDNLHTAAVLDLVANLTGLDLSELQVLIYDVCEVIGVDYTVTAKSTLAGQTEWKKGAYTADFDQADMLTVVLSFLLEWITVDENAAALDEMLGTDGIVASIESVFADVSDEIVYSDPDWMYWFDTEAEFNEYVNGNKTLPNSLLALEYPNDWSEESAEYIAENLADLVDMVIGLIEIDGVKYESLEALLKAKVNVFTTENLNKLVDLISNLLSSVDANLIEAAGVLLDANIAGLAEYECTKDITTADAFAAELANVLTTYAGGLVDWIFFGKDYRFAKMSDGTTDTIVINGGEGYEKGLALVLEALGCEVPAADEATVENVLASLAARVDEILGENAVNEVVDLLPNLVYFLNANGLSVAVDNLLQPVYALLTKLEVFGLNVSLQDIIKIEVEKEDGTTEEVAINLETLTLEYIVGLVETLTGLNLEVVDEILVDFCLGKIEKLDYTYKMAAERKDTITLLLTVALLVIETEGNDAALNELIGSDVITAVKKVFESAPVQYGTPNWDYCWDTSDIDYVYGTIGVIESALNYPNDWTEEKAKYIAENLPMLVDTVVSLIEIDGVKYENLAALIDAKLDIYTEENLKAIQKALNDLIGGLDADVKEIVDVALGAADALLGADVNALLTYDVTGANGKEAFVNALTGMLMEVEGLVDWLLFGENYELFVDDDGDMKYEDGEEIITLNGGHGYAEGLALVLEALGCKNLPTVYDKDTVDTQATVKAVLTSLANRIDEVLANPVKEVVNLLPNLIYFLNANGVAAAVNNVIGAINALTLKLEGLGVNVDINSLVNLPKILKIEDMGATISLDNLAMKDILQAVTLKTGLDITVLEDVLNGFALGDVQAYESISRTGTTFKMQYEDAFDKHDMITVLVTAVLLVIETEGNEEVLNEMLGSEIITHVKNIISGTTVSYNTPDWLYAAADNETLELVDYAITYPNNWTEDTAKYVAENLAEIVDEVMPLVSEHDSLAALLGTVEIFTSTNLQKVVDAIKGLLDDINSELLGVGLILDVDLEGLMAYTAPAGITTVDAFAAELANILNTYAKGVVEWLLLGDDYRFFVNDANGDDEFNNGNYTEGEDIVTITGGHGYAEGLALVLEALGCKNLPDVYAKEYTAEEAVTAVLTSLADRIEEIFANPVKEVVDLLPNLIYFLNTNGLAAVVDNTIAAITALLEELKAFGVDLDINELVDLPKLLEIEDKGATISLDNLAMSDILQAVSLKMNLDITMLEDVLVGFALGKLEEYTSVSNATYSLGEKTYKMVYADEFDKADMLTVVVTLALLTLSDEDNKAVVVELLGEDVYNTIINLLNMDDCVPAMKEMNWILTEYADTNTAVSGITNSELYEGWGYGPLYTEEMAQYIADNFGRFIDNIVYLLGIEINGESVESLEEIFDELLDGTLYTTDTLNSVLELLRKIPSFITDFAGADLTKHVNEILNRAIGVDLTYWDTYTVAEVSDRNGFVAELCRMLEPFYPVLKWLLADEDFAFFVDGTNEGDDMIVLYGAEGYAYGIAPILEALQCEGILSNEAYLAAVDANDSALLLSIINPLLDKVDSILYAEENGSSIADEVLALLPSVIYFINSNGLDTSVKNILNAVYTVLNAVEPVTGEVNLYDLIGLDLENLTFEEIFELALKKIGEATGYDLSSFSVDYIAELTTGYVVSYTTASGETAYTMVYAEGESGDAADMVTVVLRLALTFLACGENQQKVLNILAEQFGMDENAKKYLAGVFEAVAECEIGTYLGMDKACAVVYYLFYSADIGADFAATGIKDLNSEWQQILEELGKTEAGTDPTFGNLISRFLDVTMKDILEDVFDSEGVATNGFIKFFQRIAEWFKALMAWFQKVFA